ncbi:unnamed protein product [Parnassius apollo]|uniref:(apollo) hypothetical protein n=1 Tax=Parnassius apollo TaxID=110799 RepID=A0A8S3VYC1_PARAO|nr:unnamed protein product [Parnassius apollo]
MAFVGKAREGRQSSTDGSEMQARLLYVVALCAAAAHAARLLAVLPTNTRSHYAMYGRLIEALAKRQHHVTVMTHFTKTKCNYSLKKKSND